MSGQEAAHGHNDYFIYCLSDLYTGAKSRSAEDGKGIVEFVKIRAAVIIQRAWRAWRCMRVVRLTPAAVTIQRAWRECMLNPGHSIGRKYLNRKVREWEIMAGKI